MKRKIIIIIFVIAILLSCYLISKIFVRNGQELKNVVYKSQNLIIHIAKEGTGENLIVLGSGYSLDIDENNKITNHDPLMTWLNIEPYNQNATVISIYYPFESSGLEAAGKELSNFINQYAKEYEEIIFIGHSKCGVCFANMAKWIAKQSYFVTISTSFYGTPIVDQEKITQNLSWFNKKIYHLIFGNHNVDKDLIPNSAFVQNVDYSGLEKHHHINIISSCPQKTWDPLAIVLKYIDKKGNIQGDGITPKTSQQFSVEGTITHYIEAVHPHSWEIGIEIAKQYIPYL